MKDGEGDKSTPGCYRKQAVKVGDLVPTQSNHIPSLMAQLERFINTNKSLPPLIKAGLAHIQFEMIHPFLDGNGRIGRLLIVLMLIDSQILSEPIIYPSYYFKKHRLQYYKLLDEVRTQGNFEGWIEFYLKAIKESSIDAFDRSKKIESLGETLTKLVEKKYTKAQNLRLQALSIFFSTPVINIKELAKQLNATFNTASKVILDFVELNILVEATKQKRDRLFKFKPYLDILEKEYLD